MATWTNIPNTSIETDKPIRAVDGRALRDNPIAIAEGASGAPRIQTEAIEDDAVTGPKMLDYPWGSEDFQTGTSERDWVLARTAASASGAVGTYALVRVVYDQPGSPSSPINYGGNVGGSFIAQANASGGAQGPTQSGTWKCMGYSEDTTDETSTTLFLRIA